jgi:hypothetical protein
VAAARSTVLETAPASETSVGAVGSPSIPRTGSLIPSVSRLKARSTNGDRRMGPACR